MAVNVGTLLIDIRYNTGDLSRRLEGDLSRAGDSAGAALNQGLGARLTKIGASAANAGRQISLGLGLPLLAIGRSAAQSFLGFDKAMTQINALVGISRDQTNAWRGDVRNLAAQYGQSSTDVAEALYFITSSGVDASKALEVLEISTKGAAIGLGSAKTVADAVTSAVNAYGAENLSAAKAADILTVAVREGKGEADKLAGALASVIPIASSLGVSYGEVAGSMSAMTLSGTSADEAATQLRAILNTLADMPPIAQRALKAQTGLDYATVRQNLSAKGLIPTLKEITDAFKGNEEGAAEVFGNVRALTGVTNLFGAKTQQTISIVNQATAAHGDFNRAMEDTAQSAAYQFEQAKAQIDAAMVDIGASVVPVMASVSSAIATLVSGINTLPGPLKNAVVGLGGLAAAAGPILYIGGSATRLAGILAGPLTHGWRAAGEAMFNLTNSANNVKAGFGEVGLRAHAAASALAGPLVAAAGTAIVTFSLLNAKLEENQAAFKALEQRGKTKNNQAESWDEIQERIARANAETEKFRGEIEAIDAKGGKFGLGNIGNLGLAYDRRAAQEAGETAMAVAKDASNLAALAQVVADKFGLSRDAAVKWVAAQRQLNPEVKTGEDVVKAYQHALDTGDESIKTAVADTEKAKKTFSGLIAAVKATSDTFFGLVGAEDSYKSAQKAIADAKDDVVDAERAHVDAMRQSQAAVRRVEDAERRLIQSGRRLAEARQAAADAQKALNDALAGPSLDEQLNVESAQISLEEARGSLREPSTDPLDRRRKQLEVRRAEEALRQARSAHDERLTDARKDLTAATEGVSDAEAAQRDASQAVLDAQDSKREADRKVGESLDAIKAAQDKVVEAERAAIKPAMELVGAQDQLNIMLQTGTIEANNFRNYLIKLKEMYPELGAELDKYIARVDALPQRGLKTGEVFDPEAYGHEERRAFGGPLSVGQLSTVNERDVPELWTQGGKQYLLPLHAGRVVPLSPADMPVKGGDGVSVGDINVYEVSGKPRQTAYEVRREVHKMSYLAGQRR